MDSETSRNFDVGIKVKTERLQAELSVSYNMIDDYIVNENQGNGSYQYMNYAKVNLYGSEASVDYDCGGGFSTFAVISYVCGENDDTGEDLSGIPSLKGHQCVGSL